MAGIYEGTTQMPSTGSSAGHECDFPDSSTSGGRSSKGAIKVKKVGHRRVSTGGHVTYKKIQTSQIMGSIQLGVEHAIGQLYSKPHRDLLFPDFSVVEKFYFPSKGTGKTPPHEYSDFHFKAYAPMAFRHFRARFDIQADEFLMSLCTPPLIELSNPGASGSIFYLTFDDEFIIKTVQRTECSFLRQIMPGYFNNLLQNPHTLLPKLFGLFTYQCYSKNIKLIVMNNLLPSTVKIHQKYDLKGSTHKRKANGREREKASPTFKDLDFLEHYPNGIFLEEDTHASLLKTLQRDCLVLKSFDIMDYSLLVGIHDVDLAAKEKAEYQSLKSESQDKDEGSGEAGAANGAIRSKFINRQEFVPHSTVRESFQTGFDYPIDSDDEPPLEGIPAWNSKGERLVLYLGIIDILQSYGVSKKLEHSFKAILYDKDAVSVNNPEFYEHRFMEFMTKCVFRKLSSQ